MRSLPIAALSPPPMPPHPGRQALSRGAPPHRWRYAQSGNLTSSHLPPSGEGKDAPSNHNRMTVVTTAFERRTTKRAREWRKGHHFSLGRGRFEGDGGSGDNPGRSDRAFVFGEQEKGASIPDGRTV